MYTCIPVEYGVLMSQMKFNTCVKLSLFEYSEFRQSKYILVGKTCRGSILMGILQAL